MEGQTPLKRLREERGLTAQQLADKSGVNYVTIYRIESGKSGAPQPATAHKLAEALDVDVSALTRSDVHELTGPLTVDWALSLSLTEFINQIDEAPYSWVRDLEIRFGEEFQIAAATMQDDPKVARRAEKIAQYSRAMWPVLTRKHEERYAGMQGREKAVIK